MGWGDYSNEAMERVCRASQFDDMEELRQLDDAEDKLINQQIEAENRRQARILAGEEQECFACGCSESLPCPGGCVWATPTLCSRCV